jgi:hypothetical protein
MTKPRFLSLRVVMVLAVLVAAIRLPRGVGAAEGDWPMWRYDAGRTAASPLELPAQLIFTSIALVPMPQAASWPPGPATGR